MSATVLYECNSNPLVSMEGLSISLLILIPMKYIMEVEA